MFLSRFLAVSLHEKPKNIIKMFFRPENRKNLGKKGREVGTSFFLFFFFFFLRRPLRSSVFALKKALLCVS
jgi:hypothetical protein